MVRRTRKSRQPKMQLFSPKCAPSQLLHNNLVNNRKDKAAPETTQKRASSPLFLKASRYIDIEASSASFALPCSHF